MVQKNYITIILVTFWHLLVSGIQDLNSEKTAAVLKLFMRNSGYSVHENNNVIYTC